MSSCTGLSSSFNRTILKGVELPLTSVVSGSFKNGSDTMAVMTGEQISTKAYSVVAGRRYISFSTAHLATDWSPSPISHLSLPSGQPLSPVCITGFCTLMHHHLVVLPAHSSAHKLPRVTATPSQLSLCDLGPGLAQCRCWRSDGPQSSITLTCLRLRGLMLSHSGQFDPGLPIGSVSM